MASSEDATSPYFLHPSDSPGLSLVSQLLTEDNYCSRRRAMKMSLFAKKKIGLVDGSIQPPDPTDAAKFLSDLSAEKGAYESFSRFFICLSVIHKIEDYMGRLG
ncbi:hypothetical protein L6164_023688 [Bauhinia variegata]|uniref:Uncharacterized protein n=1 Tax=Bauhinia variegata TaxID=167791 RepID=A0ACB9MP44_BAUVA|nr:hypothetical protein L6164_023688 [Bauhinia variegata]